MLSDALAALLGAMVDIVMVLRGNQKVDVHTSVVMVRITEREYAASPLEIKNKIRGGVGGAAGNMQHVVECTLVTNHE